MLGKLNENDKFLRPYEKRWNFSLDLGGLPQETPFELYCLYR